MSNTGKKDYLVKKVGLESAIL